MKRIQFDNGFVFATNLSGQGVFFRFAHEGMYRQYEGTCQTPTFRTKHQFTQYVYAGYADTDGAKVVDSYGWEE